ncbi:hypothetical protein [Snodgrassella communis]|uniref:hypothetical protein n=1 Tax=Snodgrassella communis TaxID=2946699 RepID=UPI002147435B|nr:hypothetical protein [Snodgrassella communis]
MSWQRDDLQRQPGLVVAKYVMQFGANAAIQYDDDFFWLYALRAQAIQTGVEPVRLFLCIQGEQNGKRTGSHCAGSSGCLYR